MRKRTAALLVFLVSCLAAGAAYLWFFSPYRDTYRAFWYTRGHIGTFRITGVVLDQWGNPVPKNTGHDTYSSAFNGKASEPLIALIAVCVSPKSRGARVTTPMGQRQGARGGHDAGVLGYVEESGPTKRNAADGPSPSARHASRHAALAASALAASASVVFHPQGEVGGRHLRSFKSTAAKGAQDDEGARGSPPGRRPGRGDGAERSATGEKARPRV